MKLFVPLSSVRKSEWMNVQNFYKSKLKCLALWILNYLLLWNLILFIWSFIVLIFISAIFSVLYFLSFSFSLILFRQQFLVYFFIYPVILFFRVSRISLLSPSCGDFFQKIMVHLFRFFLKSLIKRYVAYCYCFCCCFLVEMKI